MNTQDDKSENETAPDAGTEDEAEGDMCQTFTIVPETAFKDEYEEKP